MVQNIAAGYVYRSNDHTQDYLQVFECTTISISKQ